MHTHSHKIALCGVLCALSVALLLAGNLLQIGTYAAPMLAAFLVMPVREEYGARTALLLYLGTALLAVLLVPDKELALFYALVIGYYPALQKPLDRLRPAVLRWGAKLALFNAAAVALYALLLTVLISPDLQAEFAEYDGPLLAALLLIGNVAFVIFDMALHRLNRVYHIRLRARLRKYL